MSLRNFRIEQPTFGQPEPAAHVDPIACQAQWDAETVNQVRASGEHWVESLVLWIATGLVIFIAALALHG